MKLIKKIGLVLLVLIVIGVVYSCASGDTEQTEKENKVVVEDTEQATEATTEASTEQEKAKEGSTFTAGDLKITVDKVSKNFTDYEDEFGFYTPQDGNKYVMAEFTFENTGDSDAFVSAYDFTCYADNTNCEQSFLFDDEDFSSVNLSPGRNVSFKVYFEVPENAKNIELEYETDMWTGEKETIVIK